MIVMPANSTGIHCGYLAGRYPGLLGHLYSPGAQTGPYPWMPYALDNGAFGAFTSQRAWNRAGWGALLRWAADSGQAPRWTLVPDVVGDRDGTLRMWDEHAAFAAEMGWPLAFAAQDGMVFDDVPPQAEVVFLGGGTAWKLAALRPWCAYFPRIHVGRVNGYRMLRLCEAAGAESCDGTGWFRGDREQLRGLETWLAEVSGEKPRDDQTSLSFEPTAGPTELGSRSSGAGEPA